MSNHDDDSQSTGSDISDVSNEDGWVDANSGDEQDESVAVISLLDDRVFPDATSMLAYCKDKYELDFLAVRNRLGLDFYGSIKLINFSEMPPSPLPLSLSRVLTAWT